MAISLVTVGGKITATLTNLVITRANAQGTTGIVPTSVAGSGVSVGSNGVVTFTAATAVSVNGCFTSSYDRYQIVFDFTTSGAAALNVTLRASGTDSSTGYDSQRSTAVNATAAAAQSLSAANWIGSGAIGITGARHSGDILIYNPALAVATTALIRNSIIPNPMTTASGLYSGALGHQTASAYDGFTFTPGTGNITGTIRVYGLNNN
jgi:hypothetical protein